MASKKPLPKATAKDARVTPDDVKDAKEAWRKAAPPQFKNLLDATSDDA